MTNIIVPLAGCINVKQHLVRQHGSMIDFLKLGGDAVIFMFCNGENMSANSLTKS